MHERKKKERKICMMGWKGWMVVKKKGQKRDIWKERAKDSKSQKKRYIERKRAKQKKSQKDRE